MPVPRDTPPSHDMLQQARTWAEHDIDPVTASLLRQLIAHATDPDNENHHAAAAELVDSFIGKLEFGTAGLRGRLGPGPNRMNRMVVIRTTAGVADYVKQQLAALADDHGPATNEPRQVAPPRVVVGFDARHNSEIFARDVCATLTAAGCQALLLPPQLPTPILAYATKKLAADAGIMVTASHNPPQDNGYKVYFGGRIARGPAAGVQLISPADQHISQRIDLSPPADEIPRADSGWQQLSGDIVQQYLSAVATVLDPAGPRDISIVLTPLHGVGGAIMRDALAANGFPEPYLVPEQADPDPDFPTVAFPNPEEPGALDFAVAAAQSRGADVVIANDPDADRCAVAVPDRDGRWRMLTGDQVGALLGEYVLRTQRWKTIAGTLDSLNDSPPVVASSIVSCQQLARIAASHGIQHRSTLTGFKWISRVPGLVFGYEEALGYCIAPEAVRDKDGISTGLLIAELVAQLRHEGRNLNDELDRLALAHGVFVTGQVSLRFADLSHTGTIMTALRANPPATLLDQPLSQATDLLTPQPDIPSTDALRWHYSPHVRIIVRPSGTEPKLKCYLEISTPPPSPQQLRQVQQHAETQLVHLAEQLRALLVALSPDDT